jgi:DNA-binding NarL/FixJ family response regulator
MNEIKSSVLVVDDHPIVREGLAGLINSQADLVCTGSAGSIAEAQAALEHKPFDVLLLDLRVGASDGLETIKSFTALFPSVPILVISQFEENTYAERALRAGARGYIMKEQATDELLAAIRHVLSGKLYFSPRFARRAIEQMLDVRSATRDNEFGVLSDRELHVFKELGAGKSNRQIATDLHLSIKTIETYREHIKYKLGLAGGAELIERAKKAAQDQA